MTARLYAPFFTLLTLLLALGPAARAEAVRVRSAGGTEAGGLSFARAGRTYVVTSHIAANQRPLTVQDGAAAARPASVLAWDWGAGLALLEVPGLAASPMPAVATPAVLQAVSLAGAPAGAVVMTDSDRHFVPSLARMFEVVGQPLDYVAVGSPLLDPALGWIGLVSHGAIVEQNGDSSLIVDRSEVPTYAASHWLAIQSSSVVEFVTRYLAAPAAWQPLIAYSEGRTDGAARVGGLVFSARCSAVVRMVDGKLEVGGNGAGIGGNGAGIGGNGAGIGGNGAGIGGNGAGIGGNGAGIGGVERGHRACRIDVREDAASAPAWLYESSAPTFARLRETLRAGGADATATISGELTVPSATSGFGPRLVRFESLAHFFRQFEFIDRVPLVILPVAPGAELARPLSELRAEGRALSQALAATTGRVESAIRLIPEVIASEEWRRLPVDRVSALAEAADPALAPVLQRIARLLTSAREPGGR